MAKKRESIVFGVEYQKRESIIFEGFFVKSMEPVITPYESLKLLCEIKGWKYDTLNKKKMPFEYKGVIVDRKKIVRQSIR